MKKIRLMNILITNDDGYNALGIKRLVKILKPYGKITVIAPKYHQSGTSMAVTMGLRPIAVKKISEGDNETWYYVDGTPASCVKYAIDEVFTEQLPDIVVSGINHGANTSSAALYSGTLGAAKEAALADIPAIGVSVDDMSRTPDFSAVEAHFPTIFEDIVKNIDKTKFGIYYNVNFPKGTSIKGIRTGHQGVMRWLKEFDPFDTGIYERLGTTPKDMGITALPEVEEGEDVYVMFGHIWDDPRNTPGADHHLNKEGYISITAHNIDTTDYAEVERLNSLGFNKDF